MRTPGPLPDFHLSRRSLRPAAAPRFLPVLLAGALVATACGGGVDSLTSGTGDDGGPEPTATPASEADPTAEPESPATPEPSEPAEPTPEPTEAPPPTPPPPPPSIIAVFGDGTIDFAATEANLRDVYGGPSPAAVVAWFESRGIVPAEVTEIHRETLGTLDPSLFDILLPFVQVVTAVACEAGALGWNSTQFFEQYVAWNLATQEGDPANLEVVAQAVAAGAITAADQICTADSPSNASGDPQLPATTTETPPPAPPPSGGFVDDAAALAGCTPEPSQGATGAELDYQATLVALGFFESFDDAVFLPIDAVNCWTSEARTSGLKLWQFADITEALLASEPIVLAAEDAEGSCWAITAFFEYLVLGVSAPGVTPTAVDNVTTLAPLDAPVVNSGGECG